MSCLKVTFDTNVLKGVVTPECCADDPQHSCYVAVHRALHDGRIRGYFAEAVVALDALGRQDKVDVIGGAHLVSESFARSPTEITISIGPRWNRTPIHQRFIDRIRKAQSLGMRAMIGPRRIGDSLVVTSFGEDFYEPYSSPSELVTRGEKANEVDAALACRGLGRSRAVCLGLEFSARDGATGEWWPQGLGRTSNDTERKKVHAAINEWADGDAVASHVGYCNDVFCTFDHGAGSGQRSALHPVNRAWLTVNFGVVFLNIAELAQRIAL